MGPMKFPMRIQIKEYHTSDDFLWKTLCIVYDNEALGIMERLLATAFEFRTQSVEEPL